MAGISEEMRQEILLRDGVCQFCKGHKDLRVEYINPDRPTDILNLLGNLTVVCVDCEEAWQLRRIRHITDRWFRSLCKPSLSQSSTSLTISKRVSRLRRMGMGLGIVKAGLALGIFYALVLLLL